jgi:redox-sensitive bicupin YhaK (pirin superfamily)
VRSALELHRPDGNHVLLDVDEIACVEEAPEYAPEGTRAMVMMRPALMGYVTGKQNYVRETYEEIIRAMEKFRR